MKRVSRILRESLLRFKAARSTLGAAGPHPLLGIRIWGAPRGEKLREGLLPQHGLTGAPPTQAHQCGSGSYTMDQIWRAGASNEAQCDPERGNWVSSCVPPTRGRGPSGAGAWTPFTRNRPGWAVRSLPNVSVTSNRSSTTSLKDGENWRAVGRKQVCFL